MTHLFVQQDPGPLNSMGKLKFPFPNPEDIYLHDTPNKALFAKNVRFLSNGCVRVEDAQRLGRWLLGQDPEAPTKEPELRVQIPKGIPIVLTYLTARVEDGKVTYVPDVYGWDKTLRRNSRQATDPKRSRRDQTMGTERREDLAEGRTRFGIDGGPACRIGD